MDRNETLKRLEGARVGVLMGGVSSEREVSLKTGAAALASLERLGLNAVGVDVGADILSKLPALGVDLAFVALHGRLGEDGAMQGALELAGIPYTGSGVAASAIAMSKTLTKLMCKAMDVATPACQVFFRDEFGQTPPRLEMDAPAVVKPANGGSSIGVSICRERGQIMPAVRRAFEEDREVLVEEYINGPLITVGVAGGRALAPVEIETAKGFYDYANKYTPGGATYHVPARLDEEMIEKTQQVTLTMHRAMRCRGVTRSELIVDNEKNVWFIELNTIPGMTETSLLPKAAAAAGMTFDDLVAEILAEALEHETP